LGAVRLWPPGMTLVGPAAQSWAEGGAAGDRPPPFYSGMSVSDGVDRGWRCQSFLSYPS